MKKSKSSRSKLLRSRRNEVCRYSALRTIVVYVRSNMMPWLRTNSCHSPTSWTSKGPTTTFTTNIKRCRCHQTIFTRLSNRPNKWEKIKLCKSFSASSFSSWRMTSGTRWPSSKRSNSSRRCNAISLSSFNPTEVCRGAPTSKVALLMSRKSK